MAIVKSKEAKAAKKLADAKKAEKENKKNQAKEVKAKTPVTEATAIARDIRLTPRKARLLIDLIRGKDIATALAILNNTNKIGVHDIVKVVKSAAANATNNFGMNMDKLYIAKIYANEGIRMKRFMPRAKGSASGKVKRASIVTCVVKER